MDENDEIKISTLWTSHNDAKYSFFPFRSFRSFRPRVHVVAPR